MRADPPVAGFRKAVVLCVDPPYLPFALFLATQIDQKEPRRDFDICLISDAPLTIPAAFDGLHLKLPAPLSDDAYDRLRIGHLARSTYLRMWAPHLLRDIYDRIIYLDSDVFLDGSGFSRLFEIEMQGKPLAAVRDVQQWYRPERTVKEFELAGRSTRPYFNAGMLVIDVPAYLHTQVLERALEIGTAHPEWIRHHDQSLLNLALDGDWLELAPVWNWQWPWKYPLFTDWIGPRVLHFIGEGKPWADPSGYCPKRFQMAYAEFFEQHFPNLLPLPEARVDVLHSWQRMAWLALRFLGLRRRLLRFIDQFPDPYAVRQATTGQKARSAP